MSKESNKTAHLLNNVTNYPVSKGNATLPKLVTDETGSTYLLINLGLELPAALGAIYQDLLTPEMKSKGMV